jgi:hypothetical protein
VAEASLLQVCSNNGGPELPPNLTEMHQDYPRSPDLPRTKGLQQPIGLIYGQILSAFMTFIMEMSTACYKEVTAGILFLPDYVDLRLMRLFNVILRVKFVQDLVGLFEEHTLSLLLDFVDNHIGCFDPKA